MAEATRPGRIRFTLTGALALLASTVALSSPAASATPAPPAPHVGGPPFDLAAPTPHHLSFTIDTAPARDVLALLSGAPDATATLRRLRASANATAAIRAEGLSPDDFYGRLVSTIAGTPDPLLGTFIAKSPYFTRVLDALESEGRPAADLEGRRIASLLPTKAPITAAIVLVPFFGVSGFTEVAGAREGETLVLSADLPRLTGDLGSAPMPRELLLKMLRAASAEAWRALFEAHVRKSPAWPDERAADFDAFVSHTAAEGVPTLFLIPDDFFPIIPLLEEPIQRAYARWNHAAEVLLEGKKKDTERQELFANASCSPIRPHRISSPRRSHALSRSHERQTPARVLEGREEGARTRRREAREVLRLQRTGSSGNAVASGGSSGGCSVHSRSLA